MKALLFCALALLWLTGCGLDAALPNTEPVQVVRMSSPETPVNRDPPRPTASVPAPAPRTASIQTDPPVTEPPATEPIQTEPLATEPPVTAPPVTAPPVTAPPATEPPTEPIPYPYGDTTPTWDPALAGRYPADEDCDDALLLEKWMAVEGLTLEDLEARDCRQLILAAAQPTDGVETVTVCCERSPEGGFVPVEALGRMSGFVGKNGIKHDRRRNTLTSPAGLWAIGWAFGNELPPAGLKLPWRQVTSNSDWVCDEDSPYFNTWRERDDPDLLPWSDDVEHLENYPTQYAWACVIEFNRPPDVVPARGCAIFLHVSTGGTAGCVGLCREDMLAVLGWLDPEKNPYILITGAEKS